MRPGLKGSSIRPRKGNLEKGKEDVTKIQMRKVNYPAVPVAVLPHHVNQALHQSCLMTKVQWFIDQKEVRKKIPNIKH